MVKRLCRISDHSRSCLCLMCEFVYVCERFEITLFETKILCRRIHREKERLNRAKKKYICELMFVFCLCKGKNVMNDEFNF